MPLRGCMLERSRRTAEYSTTALGIPMVPSNGGRVPIPASVQCGIWFWCRWLAFTQKPGPRSGPWTLYNIHTDEGHYAVATCLVMWLARRYGKRTEKAIWAQAHKERRFFLRNCWPTIDAMAIRLRKSGFVSRRELQMLTKSYQRRCVTELVRPIL